MSQSCQSPEFFSAFFAHFSILLSEQPSLLTLPLSSLPLSHEGTQEEPEEVSQVPSLSQNSSVHSEHDVTPTYFKKTPDEISEQAIQERQGNALASNSLTENVVKPQTQLHMVEESSKELSASLNLLNSKMQTIVSAWESRCRIMGPA